MLTWHFLFMFAAVPFVVVAFASVIVASRADDEAERLQDIDTTNVVRFPRRRDAA